MPAPTYWWRCADIDLGRWFKGDYAVPVVEEDEGISEGDFAEEE